MTLEGQLEVDAGADGAATFSFTVVNAGEEPVVLQFADACKADFAVEEGGREVWRFSDGRLFAQMIEEERLEPDERVTYDAEWPDPEEGEYTAVATLQARAETCETRTDFSV